ECSRIGSGGLLVVGDRLTREKPSPHGTDAVGGEGNPGPRGHLGDALSYRVGFCFETRVDFRGVLLQIADGREARGHGEWIAAERSRLINGPQRRQKIHELLLAAEYADRQSSAHDFAQRNQVRIECIKLAGTAEGNT